MKIKRFNNIFPYIAIKDNYMDYYDIPIPNKYDHTNKHTIQKINGVTYVKLRLKDSTFWGPILTKILGKEIIIAKDYETTDKKISELYKKFKLEYKIPTNYYNDIKKCKLFNYFYSEKEMNEYLMVWSNKVTTTTIPYTEEQYKFYIKISSENQICDLIQVEHYIDNGCRCQPCSSKRKSLLTQLKGGIKITGKIVHAVEVQKYNNNIKKTLIAKIKETSEKNKQLTSINVTNSNTIRKRNITLNNTMGNQTPKTASRSIMNNIIINSKNY